MSEHVVLGFDPKFTICPHQLIYDKNLSHLAVRVWLILRAHADANARCYPGQDYLGEKLDISPRHARRILEELRDKKWLKWAPRNNRRTEGPRTNLYTLLMPSRE